MVNIWAFTAVDPGSIPGWRTKIPHAVQHGKKQVNKNAKRKQKIRDVVGMHLNFLFPHDCFLALYFTSLSLDTVQESSVDDLPDFVTQKSGLSSFPHRKALDSLIS